MNGRKGRDIDGTYSRVNVAANYVCAAAPVLEVVRIASVETDFCCAGCSGGEDQSGNTHGCLGGESLYVLRVV